MLASDDCRAAIALALPFPACVREGNEGKADRKAATTTDPRNCSSKGSWAYSAGNGAISAPNAPMKYVETGACFPSEIHSRSSHVSSLASPDESDVQGGVHQ